MKTSGTTDGVDGVLPLTKKQKIAGNVSMGVLLVAAGVILALAGAGVIHVSVRKIAAATILLAFGTGVLIGALIAKNSISMWIAGVILSCALTSLLVAVTPASYYNLFPIYIAAPAVGCALSVIFADAKLACVKCGVFFSVLAGLFALASSGLCGWGLTGGLIAAFGGVCVIAYAVGIFLKKDQDNA